MQHIPFFFATFALMNFSDKHHISHSILLFLLAALPFWLLDSQAVWLGDDFGYFFADSSLHNGDGDLITSIPQILRTQALHWSNCNGRFIVHSLVMFFTAICGPAIFSFCNALMFGCLFILFCRLVLPRKIPSLLRAIVLIILLWLCIPVPGVTMLSLVAYSINYLWTSVAILFFILIWERTTKKSIATIIACSLYALFSAALQESFSLPLSAALLIWWIVNRKTADNLRISLIICFWIGTALVFFAPGNLSHAAQGGGFSLQALIDKNYALASDLMFSSINVLAILLVICAVCIPQRCAGFFRRNILLLAAIIFALLLAAVSYTAVRQLFAPSIFSAILLARLLFSFFPFAGTSLSSRILIFGLSLIYAGCIAGAYIVRMYPVKIMNSLIDRTRAGATVLVIPPDSNPESRFFYFLFERYNDDPSCNKHLKLLFDGYTKRGLSRLYHPSHKKTAVNTILPASKEQIIHALENGDTTYSDLSIRTTHLSPCWSLAKFPARPDKKNKYTVSSPDGHLGYERFLVDSTYYYVFPGNIKTLTLKPRSK